LNSLGPNINWNRRIWRLALPIILSNLSIPLVGAMDTAVMGHLPEPVFIGAVALGATIFSFIYWGFGFLRMGTTGFVAQAFGRKDDSEICAILARALILALIFGLLVILCQFPVIKVALWAFSGGERLESLAHEYFVIRIWSAPAALANYAILGCLIGIQNTRAALYLQLVLNGINIILDLVFVMGLGMTVDGVALATLIAEYCAALMGLWLVKDYLKTLFADIRSVNIFDIGKLKSMLHVNTNIFIRTISLIFAWAYFTAMGTRMGEVVLAANAVLLNFQSFLAYGLDGFAHAAEALVGSAYGSRDRRALRGAVVSSTIWAFITAIGFALIFALFGPVFIRMLTSVVEVQTTSEAYLFWLIISPFLSVWSYQLDGIFIGCTRTAEMRNGMVISLACYLISSIWLIDVLGNHGLWLALMVFMIVRAITLGMWYPRIEAQLK